MQEVLAVETWEALQKQRSRATVHFFFFFFPIVTCDTNNTLIGLLQHD